MSQSAFCTKGTKRFTGGSEGQTHNLTEQKSLYDWKEMMFWFIVLYVTVAIIRQVPHLLRRQSRGNITMKF